MNQYDANVNIVMEFLNAEKYAASVISLHRICYREFRFFLQEMGVDYTPEQAAFWLENNKSTWNYRKYTGRRHCLDQLEDVYRNGAVSPDHVGPHASAYSLLIPSLRHEVDEFLEQQAITSSDRRYSIACSRFMFYLQNHGITSIIQLNYHTLLSFYRDDYHRSSKSKDIYEDLIRTFLRYHASKGHCPLGLSLALNKMLIPKIIFLDDQDFDDSNGSTITITWSEIELFLEKLKSAGYAGSVMAYSRHILTLLYIFWDIHQIGFNAGVMWKWFQHVKPLLHTGWKQGRRSLYQFLLYIQNKEIVTDFTGDPAAKDSIERLCPWCRMPLENYLTLLKREGWQKSTIAMQKSSNLRFCSYLQNIGVQSFSEISPALLQAFNDQDQHLTAEGKVAYNCRIRGFLIYLYEQALITNPFLHKALPSKSAPSVKIVGILSDDELRQIWSVDISSLSSRALRDYSIVCIGLTMGFRASDIVSIRYQDINWKTRTISIVQQKTGKAIEMPMPVRTGNVLFRYLRDARPKSDSLYVFIHHTAPYSKLERGVCRRALLRFLPKRESVNNGFHIARRTFATGLLRGNTKTELISDSLGHSTGGTVHKYLSLDEEKMRLCPLSLKDMGISWKGGVFNA